MNTYNTLRPIFEEVGRMPTKIAENMAHTSIGSILEPKATILKHLGDGDETIAIRTIFRRQPQKPEYGGTGENRQCKIRQILIQPLNTITGDQFSGLSMEQPLSLDGKRCLKPQTPVIYLKAVKEGEPDLVMKASPKWFEGIWQAINDTAHQWQVQRNNRFNAEFVQDFGSLNSAALGFTNINDTI